MRRYFLSILFIIPLLFITGCGESLYTGAADTTTDAAITDQIDFDLINGNCQPVIDYYDNKMALGISLSDDDIYKYISANLTCSGFDLVRGVESILLDGGNDIYTTSAALLGIQFMDMNTSSHLQTYYDKAISVCYARKLELEKQELKLSTTNSTICGLAGMMGTVVNMSAMMLNTSGGGGNLLEISDNGFKDFAANDMDGASSAANLGSYLKQKNDFLMYLNNGLIMGEDGAESMGSLMGQNNFSSVLSELAAKLRDGSGNITEQSLLNYLTAHLGLAK